MSENITLQLLASFNSVNVPNVVVQLESVTSIGPLVVPFATEAVSYTHLTLPTICSV